MIDSDIVYGDDVVDVVNRALAWTQKGWDLQGGLVVTDAEVGQWIVHVPGPEYRMVDARSMSALSRQVRDLRKDGFETFHWTVTWRGVLYQWMQREPLLSMPLVGRVGKRLQVVESAMPVVTLFPSWLSEG